MTVTILKTTRSSDKKIPTELIREDEPLVNGIINYCNQYELTPIYIDNSVAIFSDYLLIAKYNDE